MRFGVRAKVFAASLTLVALVGAATGALLEARLSKRLNDRMEAEVFRHAHTARVLLESSPEGGSAERTDALADRLGETTSARVTVIDQGGAVLGDSELPIARARALDNHGDRPEVRAALQTGRGTSRRYSTTLRTEMLYVAVRTERAGHADGVVRLAVPLTEVDEAVTQMRIMLLAIGLVGLLVAVAVSGVASQLLTRRLRELVDRVRALGQLREGSSPPPHDTDELGHLAGSLNSMAAELKAAIAKLTSERDQLQTILEGMTDAVLAVDDRNRITLINPEAQALLSLADAPVGQKLGDALRASALNDFVAQSQRGGGAAVEFELQGSPPRHLLARAAPLRVTGGTVLVIQDVSEMRRLETIRRDFVANVSHELRTPVSVIRANAETLLNGAIDEPSGRGFVEAIERNAERLTALIADLLDLSRIEAGSYRLQLKAVDLAGAFERALAAMEELARKRNISLSCSVEPKLRASADAAGLDQALLNLLGNAVKYSPEGSQVELRANLDGDVVRIEVQDEGAGIKPRFRERIFERFYRVDRGRAREAGGTGLGLAIVKHLADGMSGEVGVEPAPGGGSIFWLTLAAA